MRARLESWITNQWYCQGRLCHCLTPLSWLYRYISKAGKIPKKVSLKRPIWVVGNLTVGGAGKTPLVIHVAHLAKSMGLRVLVVMKPFRLKKALTNNVMVPLHGDPARYGDEPCLIKNKTNVDVLCIAKNRNDVMSYLDSYDLIIADDGLQDCNFKRSCNWVVIDKKRGFGNGYLLPRGPMRSALKWSKHIDYVVERDGVNTLIPGYCLALKNIVCKKTNKTVNSKFFKGKNILIAAGIGNPQGFFDALREIQVSGTYKQYPDHHVFNQKDIIYFNQFDAIVVTEKDYVKLNALSIKNIFVCESEFIPNKKLSTLVDDLLMQMTESVSI